MKDKTFSPISSSELQDCQYSDCTIFQGPTQRFYFRVCNLMPQNLDGITLCKVVSLPEFNAEVTSEQ